jgi:CyaY protein
MESSEFQRLADDCLARVARWLEGFDPDELDFSTSDGVVTLDFPDGRRFVLNRQTAAQQMWLAAGARAWHYGWDAARSAWLDDRDGHGLEGRLAAVVSEKLARAVAPPR